MNWWSVTADVFSAVVTAAIVGLGVLAAEILFYRWRTAAEVTAAQRDAVGEATVLLDRPFAYGRNLLPATAELKRARQLVRDVPRGRASEVVAGYHYLDRLVVTWARLVVQAEAIEAALTLGDYALTQSAIKNVIAAHRWSRGKWDPRDSLSSYFTPDMMGPALTDDSLRDHVDRYARERALLDAYREALLFADAHWRDISWNRTTRAVRGPFAKWRARYRRRIFRRRLTIDADRRAYQIILAVDHRLDPHPLIDDAWAFPGPYPRNSEGFPI